MPPPDRPSNLEPLLAEVGSHPLDHLISFGCQRPFHILADQYGLLRLCHADTVGLQSLTRQLPGLIKAHIMAQPEQLTPFLP